MLSTMSSSTAPSASASRASASLIAVVEPPCGKPTTVLTSTPEPASSSAASLTWQGLTQTEATPKRRASSHPARASSSVSSGLSSEWSIVFASSASVSV